MPASHQVRLWYSIPATCHWIFDSQSPNDSTNLYNGKCSVLIVSLYSLVQGFLSEIIDHHLEHLKKTNKLSDAMYNYFSNKNNTGGLEECIKRFNTVINKDLTKATRYEGIKNLILLRNNIGHGKGYTTEISNTSANESHKEYTGTFQKVYNYFLDKKVIKEDEPYSFSVFFDMRAVAHFLNETNMFLSEVVHTSDFFGKEEYKRLLREAYDFSDKAETFVFKMD